MYKSCSLKEFLSYFSDVDALRFLYFLKHLSYPVISISLENLRIMLQIASNKYEWNDKQKIDFEECAENLSALFCSNDDGNCVIDYTSFQYIFEDYPSITNAIKNEHLCDDRLDIEYTSHTSSELEWLEYPPSEDENAVREYNQYFASLNKIDTDEIDEEISIRSSIVSICQHGKNSNKTVNEFEIIKQLSSNDNTQTSSVNQDESFRKILRTIIKSTLKHLSNELSSEVNKIASKKIPIEDILFIAIDKARLNMSGKQYNKVIKNLISSMDVPSIPSSPHPDNSLTNYFGESCLGKIFRRMIIETWEIYLKVKVPSISIVDNKYIDYRAGFGIPSKKYSLDYALRLLIHDESSFVVYAYVDANIDGRAVLEDVTIPHIIMKPIQPKEIHTNEDESDAEYNFKNVMGEYKIRSRKFYNRNTEVYAKIIAYNITKLMEQ